jgi:xylulokinase
LLLPVKDFLRYKLTGVAATDHYEAAATGLCNQTGREWSTETLETLEIAPHSLPPILQPNNLAGTVSERAADATGLPAGTPVVVGTGDWYAALLGSRAWLPDRASLYLGTAGVLGAFRSQPDFEYLDEAVCFGAVTSTGSAIQWIANILKSQNPKDADSPSGSIGQIAATSEVGALGLIFLPHLMGERGGAIRPHASGTLTGIRLTHQKRDIARAVLEGTAMWLRLVTTDALTTRRIDALIVSGDGARNPLNSVIAAALYQKPVIVPEVVEAGALGVALLTAEGVGLIESRADAASKWIQTKTIVNPDPELVSLYSAVFERFVRTEQMLREQEDFNSQGSV